MRGIEKPHLSQEPCDDRHLKEQPHEQRQDHKERDIRREADLVNYQIVDLITAQETKREGEDQKIIEQHSQQEEGCRANDQGEGIPFLALIERRRHKAIEPIDHQGQSKDEACPQGDFDMRHELRGKFGIEERDLQLSRAQGTASRPLSKATQRPIEHKIRRSGRKEP